MEKQNAQAKKVYCHFRRSGSASLKSYRFSILWLILMLCFFQKTLVKQTVVKDFTATPQTGNASLVNLNVEVALTAPHLEFALVVMTIDTF